ncbi:M48 family metallopeptidase [Halomicrococcus sp. SG-WS-1]|uniref:M48 family metallopeptidase n=1 Tax=Halomicrococcus sp. SG-WS-1 TaxID=3439057 RepID=UPI003F79EC4E
MYSAVVTVLAHATLALASYGLAGALAARVARTQASRVRTAARLRTLRRAGSLVGGSGAVVVSELSGVTPFVAGTLPAGIAGTAYGAVLVACVVFLGPVLLVVIAVDLAVHPYRREVRPVDATRSDVVRWFLARVPAMPLAVGVAAVVVWVAPAGWGRVVAALAVAVAGAAGMPVLLSYVLRARPPTPGECASLADLPDDVRVRVVPDATRVGVAFAAGVAPGARYVFLAESLFDVLGPAERRAVLAHELAHHRRGHVALRVVLPMCLLVPLVAAVEFHVDGAFAAVLVLSLPAAVALFRVVRWTEYDADRWAADRAGASALAGALSELADRKLVLAGPGRHLGAFASHPSIERRVARLGRAPPGRRPGPR